MCHDSHSLHFTENFTLPLPETDPIPEVLVVSLSNAQLYSSAIVVY
jgi:hypothetical protein